MLPDFSPESDRDSLDSTFSDDLEEWRRRSHGPEDSVCRTVHGKCLKDYRNVIVDMCTLTATLLWTGRGKPPPTFVDEFKSLLRAEKIHYRRLDASWGSLAKHSVRLRNAEDMRRLLCKLPATLHHVTPHS